MRLSLSMLDLERDLRLPGARRRYRRRRGRGGRRRIRHAVSQLGILGDAAATGRSPSSGPAAHLTVGGAIAHPVELPHRASDAAPSSLARDSSSVTERARPPSCPPSLGRRFETRRASPT